MSELDDLVLAIDALEARRSDLGDAVVETALGPLRERLAALRSELVGEQRRLVSILFADLVGFTPLAAAMDPEEVGEVMKAYFQRWSASIRRHGGTVEKFIGDAVLSVFGFPVAHEDDAERAVLAALDMRNELAALNDELGLDEGARLAMRVGINTGEVVVGMLGQAGREELTVIGDAVNIASRVQTAAPTGEILITADTERHVADRFDMTPFGELDLKGVAHPVSTSLIHAARPRPFRRLGRSLGIGDIRMVGRRNELNGLQSAYFRVGEEGGSQTITVVGEPGIGKSRLLQEFDEWLNQVPGISVFRGRAHSSTQNVPFGLFRDVFSEHAGIQDSDRPSTVRERLVRDLAAVSGREGVDQRVDLIARLVGFETGVGARRRDTVLDQDAFRNLAVAEVLAHFRAAGGETPAVLLLEDVHWADDASVELIELLASDPRASMLILLSARPELHRAHPDWGDGFGSHTTFHLGPLSPTEGEEMLSEMLPGRLPVPKGLAEVVLTAADGNPFFIEELMKMLVEDEVLFLEGGIWRLQEGGLGGVSVPPTLMEVLQARFDTLEPDQRTCLQRGSVVGRAFWDKAVDAMTFADGTPSSGEATASGPLLADLRSRDMVSRTEPSTFEGTEEYLFKHALLRDVSYATLLKRQRRVYHLMVARWLEDMVGRAGRESEFSRVIADHYIQGDAPTEAADWFVQAGQAAAAQFANQAALDAFDQALEARPDADPRWRANVLLEREEIWDLLADREHQFRDLEEVEGLAARSVPEVQAVVAFRQARLHLAISDYEAVLNRARVAEDLALERGEVDLAARCAVLQAATLSRRGELDASAIHAQRALDLVSGGGLPQIEADASRQLGLVAYYTGNYGEALGRFSRALDLYREAGDRRGEALAVLNLGGTNFDLGDHGAAGRHYEESLALSRGIGDRIGEAKALHNLGIVAVTRGEYEVAEKRYLEALATVRATGDRSIEIQALDNLGNLALYRYRYSEAERYLLECLSGAKEIGDRLTEAVVLINLGRCRLAVGSYEQARRDAEAAAELNRTLKDPVGLNMAINNLSRSELGLAKLQEALRLADSVLDRTDGDESPSERAEALHLSGVALHGLGRFREAADRYRGAAELRGHLNEPREELESRAALADATTRFEEPQRALAIIEKVLDHLDGNSAEGFDNPAAVFLHCYRVLVENEDPRATDVLRRGHDLVETVARLIEDDGVRRSYLTRVPAVIALTEAWTSLTEDAGTQ